MNRSSTSGKLTTGLWQPPGWLGFFWGFAEGTLFFIVPDILIGWASLAGARCGVKIVGTVLAGALLAGVLMYAWADGRPEQSQAAVASVPFVRTRMFALVRHDYAIHGLAGMLYGPGSGTPYKVYAVLAPLQHDFPAFLLMSVPARLERFALSWLVFTVLGWIFPRWIRAHPRITAALFLAFWASLYAFYWSRT